MRDSPIDAAILRRLITEGRDEEPPAEDALASLAELLNAAVPETPGNSPGECPKEEAAVAAFRAAHGQPADAAARPARAAGAAGPAAAPRSGWWRPGRRRTAVFGTVAATLLGGGAAFAAGAGPFSFGPHHERGGADQHSAAPKTPSPAPGAPQSAAPSGKRGSPAPDGTRPGGSAGPGDVDALCRDYWKKPGPQRDEALDKARFAPLVDAANSASSRDVGSYCESRPGAEGPESNPNANPDTGPNPNSDPDANSGTNGTANGTGTGNGNGNGSASSGNGTGGNGNGSATSGGNGNSSGGNATGGNATGTGAATGNATGNASGDNAAGGNTNRSGTANGDNSNGGPNAAPAAG